LYKNLPILERRGGTVTTNGYILAYDFTLFPLLVDRKYVGNTDIRGSFIICFRRGNMRSIMVFPTKQFDMIHAINKNDKFNIDIID
jgi:hypothetical protein